MATEKPAIVIACGAWHVPAHYEPVAKALRDAGYQVFTPQHQSIGRKNDAGNGLRADSVGLQRIIEQFTWRGRDVILVMHSYGGISCSDAVGMVYENKHTRIGAGRIRHLVYLAAHVIEKGQSFVGSGRVIPGIETSEEGMMTHTDPYGRYYHEISREAAEPALALLQPMMASTFQQETVFAGWKDYGIPCTFIKCSSDTAVPPALCDTYIARLRDAGVKVDEETIDAGHCAHFTRPEPVVEILLRVAGRDEGG